MLSVSGQQNLVTLARTTASPGEYRRRSLRRIPYKYLEGNGEDISWKPDTFDPAGFRYILLPEVACKHPQAMKHSS